VSDRVIAGYAAAADVLTARYCDLESDDLYAGVARFFPPAPAQWNRSRPFARRV